MYYLQSRWKLENRTLHYYGLRNFPNLFQNEIKVSKKQAEILASLPRELNPRELSLLKKFIGKQVVPETQRKSIPKSLSEATFCASCCANDFIIPGIEFDESGLCPMCQTAEEVKDLKSVVPIVEDIPRSKKSRFDIALFYTGGKDSTYLLYYLSKVKGLRVLALTWEIPYMSESAAKSIANAKKVFQILDHCSIFLLIAGSYTPFCLVMFREHDPIIGWSILLILRSLIKPSTDLYSLNPPKYTGGSATLSSLCPV